MSRSLISVSCLLLLGLLVLVGCDSVAPEEGAGEEEFFTRITLQLTGDDGSIATATATDLDGDGAGVEFIPLVLAAGMTYTGSLTLHDDINGEEVTEEIEVEGASHLFFYTPQEGVADRLVVTRRDTDGNGLPLGLLVRVAVRDGASATGTLNVKLAHYERVADKRADHTPEVRPGSEIELDLDFPVVID